jgi:hypothetical protein
MIFLLGLAARLSGCGGGSALAHQIHDESVKSDG